MSKKIENLNVIDKYRIYSNIGHETNLRLSENIKITYNTWKTHLGCMNVLVIGATGEGKSRNFVRPVAYSLLIDPKTKRKTSFVFTDPKGELYQDLAGFFESNGYQIKVLNLIDMLHSDCYNSFRYFNFSKNPDITLMNYINSLVDASSGEGNNKDTYWPNMAKNLLNSLAYYCYYELPAEYQNFSTISDMVPLFFKAEDEVEAPIDKLYKSCKNVAIDKHPAIKWRNKIKNAQGKELGSILGATNDALRLWADSNVRRITQFDTLKLDEVGDRPTALFVITPPDNSTYDFIVGTFYDQLISTLMYKANFVYNKKGLPHHVILMQDEAANTGKINDYNKKIAVWRSVNMSSIQIVQSTSQLKAMYGDKAQDVIDNCHITIFLGNGGNALDTNGTAASDFISRALGKTTVKAESYSLKYNEKEIKPTIDTSINLNQRELMTPDEVKRLKWDECIVLIKGYKPFIDKKINLNKCLNFASKLYSNQDSNGNWHLKDKLIYNIEERLHTLDSFNIGYKECSEIDLMQYEAVKKRLTVDALFSSFRDEKRENLRFIDNTQFLGLYDIPKYLCVNTKYYSAKEMVKRYKDDETAFGCYMRESVISNYEKGNINKEENESNDKSSSLQGTNRIEIDTEEHLNLEEIKIITKMTDNIKSAIKVATKGKKEELEELFF